MSLKLAFMGTPNFAVPSLDALLKAGYEVTAVYTQPPRPAGRGYTVHKTPVHIFAETHHLPVFTPSTLKDPLIQQELFALGVEAIIVVAYGLLLPECIINHPRLGCLNVHASLLPRWRGAAPIQRALLAGDKEMGVTIMKMDKGLDTGPILLKSALPKPCDHLTFEEAHGSLAALGADALLKALKAYQEGSLAPMDQPQEGVTYAAKLLKEEGQIKWVNTASFIERQVRALNPWPGVWFDYKGQKIRILKGTFIKNKQGLPGTILDSHLTIACGTGAFQPTFLQRPGGKPLEREEFLRGFPIPMGTCLSQTALNLNATL